MWPLPDNHFPRIQPLDQSLPHNTNPVVCCCFSLFLTYWALYSYISSVRLAQHFDHSTAEIKSIALQNDVIFCHDQQSFPIAVSSTSTAGALYQSLLHSTNPFVRCLSPLIFNVAYVVFVCFQCAIGATLRPRHRRVEEHCLATWVRHDQQPPHPRPRSISSPSASPPASPAASASAATDADARWLVGRGTACSTT